MAWAHTSPQGYDGRGIIIPYFWGWAQGPAYTRRAIIISGPRSWAHGPLGLHRTWYHHLILLGRAKCLMAGPLRVTPDA